jgi:hypothetical protein
MLHRMDGSAIENSVIRRGLSGSDIALPPELLQVAATSDMETVMSGVQSAATDGEFIRLVQSCISQLHARHPAHDIRVVISTCPPGYPNTAEQPARPVMIELPAKRGMRVIEGGLGGGT